jgi:hypothetical protein
MGKLTNQHKRILKLIEKDKDEEGWVLVSDSLYPHLSKNMPPELVEFRFIGGRYRAKLTEEGVSIVNAMKWL